MVTGFIIVVTIVVFRGGRKSWEAEKLLENDNSSGGDQINGVRMRRWIIGIFGVLFASLIFMNSFITGQFRITHFINTTAAGDNIVEETLHSMTQKISGYLVHNEGCRIAALDPFDSISRRYMKTEKPIECENGSQIPLIESNGTAVYVNPLAQYQYYNNSEPPNCCWRSFVRKTGLDNTVTYEKECHSFQDSATIDVEFVKVECYQNDKQIYRDYHAFVPRKNASEKRCQDVAKTEAERLSLLIVGLDSISRLNFHRMMPKTVKSLEKLGAIELMGYNKVGDNTFPNLVPVLSGLSVEEIESESGCWHNKKKPFDDCPFIWKNFSDSGYRTVFAEDACSMTTFNYIKPGFHNPPTDYYLRPYCVAAEGDIGNTHKLNSNLCLGARKNFENLLHYTRKVATKFANEHYFAFIWQASLTHDFFNYPQLGDVAYSDFFDNLGNDNLLNNTALVVMSDHGMRWGDFRQTYQGRMEGSLPFVFFVFPPWWREKFPVAIANLRKNVASLTTPYDLHETMLDILEPRNILEESLRERNRLMSVNNVTRGISLFSPIPNDRTCSMADIPEHWCMCHNSKSVSVNDTRVRDTTRYLVDELNRLVKDYPQCAPLMLKKVMDAKMWSGREDKKTNKIAPWTDYTITLQTEPGGAIFEASIRHRHNDTNNKLVGSISRLNAYGKQSACVDNFNMRLYCYCH